MLWLTVTKTNMFEWLFGKPEEPVDFTPPEDCPCCTNNDSEATVFLGTTAELLASIPPPPEMAEPAVELPVEPVEEVKEEETMEKEEEKFDPWMNIELLKMALELEASKKQKMIFYVDVGTLPKAKIEDYLKEQQKKAKDKDGDYWLPRREGGRGTEIVTTPGRVSLEGVLETAQKLKEFVNTK